MDKSEHIIEMEKILDEFTLRFEKLNEDLEFFDNHIDDYSKLVDYYYSDQWNKDFEDDNKGLIDPKLKRGVLSEDAIFDLIGDCYYTNIKMLEIATKYLKK